MRTTILNFGRPTPIYRNKREPATGGGIGFVWFCSFMLLCLVAMLFFPLVLS